MILLRIAAALCLITPVAFAGELPNHNLALLVMSSKGADAVQVFSLDHEGCMVGPVTNQGRREDGAVRPTEGQADRKLSASGADVAGLARARGVVELLKNGSSALVTIDTGGCLIGPAEGHSLDGQSSVSVAKAKGDRLGVGCLAFGSKKR